MTCDELRRHLVLYGESGISSEIANAIASHAKACGECRARVRAEKKFEAMIRSALAAQSPGDAEAWEKAMASIRRRRRPRR